MLRRTKKQQPRAAKGHAQVKYSEGHDCFRVRVWRGRGVKRKTLYGPKGDRSDAARIALEIEAEAYRGPQGVTGEETLLAYTDRQLEYLFTTKAIEANTRSQYYYASRHYGWFGDKPMLKLTRDDMKKRILEVKKDFEDKATDGDRTVRALFTVAKLMLNHAVDDGTLTANPLAGMKGPPMPKPPIKPLLKGEVPYIQWAAEKNRLEVCVGLALEDTLHTAELLGLQWENIDFENHCFTVMHNLVCNEASDWKPYLKKPKTEKRIRTLPLSDETLAQLHERRKACLLEGSGSFVITDEQGKPYRPWTFRRYFWHPIVKKAADEAERVAREAGDRKYRFPRKLRIHDLRHTANVLMSDRGIRMDVAQAMMGHASIKTTQDTYGHLYDDRLVGAMDTIGSTTRGLRKLFRKGSPRSQGSLQGSFGSRRRKVRT